MRENAHQHHQISLADQVDPVDVARRIAIFAATNDDTRNTLTDQRSCEIGVSLRRPSLRMPECGTRRDRDERLAWLPSTLVEKRQRLCRYRVRYLEVRRQRTGLDAELPNQVGIVLGKTDAAFRFPNRSREERAPEIAAITPALFHARLFQNPRRSE